MNDIAQIIDESIKLELNISKLYTLFYHQFPEHGDFWWTLSIEERNHASLLMAGKKIFNTIGIVPAKMLAREIEKLEMMNYEVEFFTSKFTVSPPSPEEAFDLAIEIEESAGELHYQTFMEHESSTAVDNIFHQLNFGDTDHAQRLRDYKKKYLNRQKKTLNFPSSKDNSHSQKRTATMK